MTGRIQERLTILSLATQLHHRTYLPGTNPDTAVLDTATRMSEWLTAPHTQRLSYSPIIDTRTGQPGNTPHQGAVVQLTNTQQVTATVEVIDRGGENVPDNPSTAEDDISWVVDDTSVITAEVGEGGRSCTLTAQHTGVATLTVTAGTKSFVEAFQVTNSEADQLVVTFGEPSEQGV